MKIRTFLVLVTLIIKDVQSFNHWVVTENGRIEPIVDSPFYLRRPYDLVALLDQEKRYDDLHNLVEDLVRQKTRIEQKSTDATSNGEQIINNRCTDILKVKNNPYIMIASNGSHRFDFKLEPIQLQFGEVETAPYCKKYTQLDYSMFAYEHLEGVANRGEFEVTPNPKLQYYLPDIGEEELGRRIVYGLMKNQSSWMHYNLGLLYWWWKGNGYEAIECARRALHFAPYEYRDIPLVNLGGLFHWALKSEEAIILVRAAIDHAPDEAKNHLSLGNIYGIVKDFERTVKCFKNFNRLQPMDEFVETTKKYIQCFMKLHTGFVEYHDTLQDILTDLHDYHGQQQQMLSMQQRLLWEIAPFHYSMPDDGIIELLKNQGHNCVTQLNYDDKVATTTCDFSRKWPPGGLQLDVRNHNLRRFLRLHDAETSDEDSEEFKSEEQEEVDEVTVIKEKVVKKSADVGEEGEVNRMPPLLPAKYPTSMSTSNNLYFDAARWPSKDECLEWNLPLTEKENLDLPIFIPAENKGFQVSKMLSEFIEVPDDKEHELPWYPPLCEHPDENDQDPYISPAMRQSILKNKAPRSHAFLKNHLLKYINDGRSDEAEIGQRIITAMNKKSGPTWVLAIVASMYWRIRENTKNALTCLDLSVDTISEEFTDVVLVSMGSMLQQLGLVENALKFASLAFKVNYLEPGTNFLLALIHYQKSNPILAMYYLKNVLRIDPNYYDGEAERLLKLWACRVKLGTYESGRSSEDVSKAEAVCADREGFSGEGVVCSANGEQCKTAAIQCFRTDGGVKSVPKIISSQQCGKHGINPSILTTLLTVDGASGGEPDQSQLENLAEHHLLNDFRMRNIAIGDFYVSVFLSDEPVPEVMVHVYEKSGTYQLSKAKCKEVKDAEWLHFTSMWQSIAARNINIGPFLSPLPKALKEHVKPHCLDSVPPSSATLDHLTAMVLRKRLPHVPESSLSEWLGLMAGDQQASVKELGTKIGIALKENTTSWILATAAALYWRVIGNTEEAVTCLRQALTYVPPDMKDIPLISLANVLYKVGFLGDALEVAYIALKSHPDYVVNQFTAGNIHTSLGDLDKAVFFYRSSLALDPNFEPARERLKSILCTMFDKSFREAVDVSND